MYGKIFESTFTGSMVGSGPTVFAVWSYAIAHVNRGEVEINPRLLGAILGCTAADVQVAIDYLMAPDDDSRSKIDEGRRLVRLGQFLYRLPTWEQYSQTRDERDRREYMRDYMRNYRKEEAAPNENEQTGKSASKPGVSKRKPRLAHTDTDADTDTDTEKEQHKLKLASSEPPPNAPEPGTAIGSVHTNGKLEPLPRVNGKRTPAAVLTRMASVFSQLGDARRAQLGADQRRRIEAEMVFLYWTAQFDHPGTILDAKREKRIVARLKENESNVDELLFALDGAFRDDWTMGRAHNSERKFDQIEVIFRDRSQVERFASTRKSYLAGSPHPSTAKLQAAINGADEVHDAPAPPTTEPTQESHAPEESHA